MGFILPEDAAEGLLLGARPVKTNSKYVIQYGSSLLQERSSE